MKGGKGAETKGDVKGKSGKEPPAKGKSKDGSHGKGGEKGNGKSKDGCEKGKAGKGKEEAGKGKGKSNPAESKGVGKSKSKGKSLEVSPKKDEMHGGGASSGDAFKRGPDADESTPAKRPKLNPGARSFRSACKLACMCSRTQL